MIGSYNGKNYRGIKSSDMDKVHHKAKERVQRHKMLKNKMMQGETGEEDEEVEEPEYIFIHDAESAVYRESKLTLTGDGVATVMWMMASPYQYFGEMKSEKFISKFWPVAEPSSSSTSSEDSDSYEVNALFTCVVNGEKKDRVITINNPVFGQEQFTYDVLQFNDIKSNRRKIGSQRTMPPKETELQCDGSARIMMESLTRESFRREKLSVPLVEKSTEKEEL